MANEKNVTLELKAVCEKKQFTDKDTGSVFDYFAVSVMIDGQKIPLSIPKESKQLFKYLIGKYYE